MRLIHYVPPGESPHGALRAAAAAWKAVAEEALGRPGEWAPPPGPGRDAALAEATWIVHWRDGDAETEAVLLGARRFVAVFHGPGETGFSAAPEARAAALWGLGLVARHAPRAGAVVGAGAGARRAIARTGALEIGHLPPGWGPPAGPAARRPGANWGFHGTAAGAERVLLAFAEARALGGFSPASRLVAFCDPALGPARGRLEAHAAELGLGRALEIAGPGDPGALARLGVLAALEDEPAPAPLWARALGAGVPLVVPGGGGLAELVGAGGVRLEEASPLLLAGTVLELLEDGALADALGKAARARAAALAAFPAAEVLARALARAERGAPERPRVAVEGPFDSSYSLAIVNRELAIAIDRGGRAEAVLSAVDAPGPFTPSAEALRQLPEAARLYARGLDGRAPDVLARNMYFPRTDGMDAPRRFYGLWGWEETRVPEAIVSGFNRRLDGVATLSRFVTDALTGSGLEVPAASVGLGVTLPDGYAGLAPYPLPGPARFTFLHVSSAFPRKGVDVLIAAYFAAFSGGDPVRLVLKTFSNPHNETGAQLAAARARHPDPPEVCWIDRDLDEGALYGLYRASDVYVHAARGEGFGLPVAEAMRAGLPVIVCPNSGMADFCFPETAVCVGYALEPARSHVATPGALWAEPDGEALAQALRRAFDDPEGLDLAGRARRAKALIEGRFGWEAAAGRFLDFVAETARDAAARPKVAVVSTWNSRCGIAEYTRYLVAATRHAVDYRIFGNHETAFRPDDPFPVAAAWKPHAPGSLEALAEALAHGPEDVVHLQFNFGFFAVEALGAFVRRLAGPKRVMITFHATRIELPGKTVDLAPIVGDLALAEALFVHQEADALRLAGWGLAENVRLLPHGNLAAPPIDDLAAHRQALGLGRRRPILGTFGFLMPHKGLLELIEAVHLLRARYPEILLLAPCAVHTNPDSPGAAARCRERVAELGLERHVVLMTDFLDPDEVLALLQAADALVLPYQPTQESASGAVRFCLAVGKPLVTTPEPIFDELGAACHRSADGSPEAIAEAVGALLEDAALREGIEAAVRARVEATAWPVVGERYLAHLRGPVREARVGAPEGARP